MHSGLKNIGSALKYIVIVIVIYSQLLVKNGYKNSGFCQKLKISYDFVQILFIFFKGMYGETLDFQCQR